jgi:hypothetical protein
MRLDHKAKAALLGLTLPLLAAGPVRAEIPAWLPRYDLYMEVDVAGQEVRVRQRVTWINRHQRPAQEIVFNAHSHYQVPAGDVGFLAKMVEILRVPPEDALDDPNLKPPLQVKKVMLGGTQLHFHYQDVDQKSPFAAEPASDHAEDDPGTALVVPLPRPVGQGESVTLDIEFFFRLPQKQGRWGQWQGVTFLATWLPVVAVYDELGWHPTPFIPWHQPFFNEAGIYNVRATLPSDQQVACTASIAETRELGDGHKQIDFNPICARDFAFLCSARYQEFLGQVGGVQVRCLALPEHEHYARLMVRWACDAIPEYNRWFGRYPYPQFTIAESYFGWNGNECGGLVMIDERIFNMAHIASNFVEYLISHELCHQWWYNVVGTNGYCETWMDEGLATFFSHRLMDKKQGHNSNLLTYPNGLGWLPNIHRENYRNVGLLGTIGRGENGPTVAPMPDYKHLVNLLNLAYDRGCKIVALIEDRLGETAFFDFMRLIYAKYEFRILRVADFQHELEAYTGRSWDEFFQHWVFGASMSDWSIEKVKLEPVKQAGAAPRPVSFLEALHGRKHDGQQAYRATILLHQKADYSDTTVLGICLDGGDGYQIRLPVEPRTAVLELDDPPARIETLSPNRVRVEVLLPSKPTQITVDPDQVLVDPDRANNHWKPKFRVHFAPLYSPLEEVGYTNDYDRWNLNFGLGIMYQAYTDPWFTRSAVAGLRADFYRTEEFNGGPYIGYRTDDRSIVAGVDGLWTHWPWPRTQVGFDIEHRLAMIDNNSGDQEGSRGVLFGRYVFQYSSSLYLPPMHYLEAFADIQDHALPDPYQRIPGTNQFDEQTGLGLHYHIDYLTPYWDPAGGFRFDLTYTAGIPIFGEHESFNRVDGQFSMVKGLPDWTGPLSQTRVAARIYGATGLPNNGNYYTMGGANLFRGYDLSQRQGSSVWVASLEWRIPIVRHAEWDCCDHVVGIRNIYVAPFYDVGDAYVLGHEVGPIAHAFGAGLRVDVSWLSLIERSTVRFDVAKTINDSSAWQFWFGFQHPF